ncbi:unnamed protein product [Polarella glacialis]|uniref:Uncharacterized protein n=1 Tax=Polarella glacialis TaxID=89957 RepID=A0A813FM17_POLGL|nr:unnamed protein product [Polarella glacialis]
MSSGNPNIVGCTPWRRSTWRREVGRTTRPLGKRSTSCRGCIRSLSCSQAAKSCKMCQS